MKILLYGLNFSPEQTGTGKYTGQLAEWLAKRGHSVRVITAPPYYPFWKVQKPYHWFLYKQEVIGGVKVFRCPLWVPESPSGLKRILHHLSFAFSSFPAFIAFLFSKPDVVIAIQPSFFTGLTVAMVKPFFQYKSWLHVQDFELQAAFSLNLLKGQFLQKLIRKLERAVIHSFDHVSTVSQSMLRRLHETGVQTVDSSLFLNWIDQEVATEKVSLREQWNIPKTAKVVLYAGNLGAKQGLENLLDTAEELRDKHADILFLIVGDGAVKNQLQKTAQDKSLRNVRFMPVQPNNLFPALLEMADVHVILQKRGASDLVMPSKLGNILAIGGAVLVTADPGTELHRVINENRLGVVVEPESIPALRDGLIRLLNDPEKRRTYGEGAKKFAAENLRKDLVIGRFEEQLKKVFSVPHE